MHYCFLFGYHGPAAWPSAAADPDFDCESTGYLMIDAPNRDEALRWGVQVAAQYTQSIHPPSAEYRWSEMHYVAEVLDGTPGDVDLRGVPHIRVGEMPDLGALRAWLAD